MQNIFTVQEKQAISSCEARIAEINRKVMTYRQHVIAAQAEINQLKGNFRGHEADILYSTDPRKKFVSFTFGASLKIADLQLFVDSEQAVVDVVLADIPVLEATISHVQQQAQSRQDTTLLARKAVVDKLEGDLERGGSLTDEQIKLLVELKAA